MKKLFDLSEEEVQLLNEVKEKENLGSEVAALRHIISVYKEKTDQEALITKAIEVYEQRARGFHERLRWATRVSEENTTVLLDAVNTILYNMKIEECVPVDDFENPVISSSKEIIRNKISHFKQQKDYRRGKK